MTKIVEAIYSHGVLEPLEKLPLPEFQRVELTVRTIDGNVQRNTSALPVRSQQELDEALARLFEDIDRMNLNLRVRMPTREELYDRC